MKQCTSVCKRLLKIYSITNGFLFGFLFFASIEKGVVYVNVYHVEIEIPNLLFFHTQRTLLFHLWCYFIFVQHTPCRRCQTKCRLVEKYWICRKQQSNVHVSVCVYCSLFSHPLSANFWICDEKSMKQHQMHITSHMRIDINLQNWMKCKFFILNGIFYLSSMFFDSIFPIPYSI